MNGLSKKDKRAISKLIEQKLVAMGVKDEITYVASGKKNKQPVFDTEKNEFKVEDGKLVMQDVDVPTAMNPLRRTVRKLRNASPEEIIAFLEMPLPSETAEVTDEQKSE